VVGSHARKTAQPWRAGARWLRLLALVVLGCAAPRTPPAAVPQAQVASGSVHLALGEPRDGDPSDDVLLDHGVFVVSYNPARRATNWVAWRLLPEDLGSAPRSNHFHPDALLRAELPGPGPRDYLRSGYERGHLCPSQDRSASALANEETFVMTNMQPQRHALNVGPWEALERQERHLAAAGNELYIVAGGLFDPMPASLPGGEAIPRASFKIIVVLARGQGAADVTPATTTYAVIMPNRIDVAGTSWSDFLVAIDEIELQSGYDFLPQVATATQAVLEAAVAPAIR
jgi:endonuclease G